MRVLSEKKRIFMLIDLNNSAAIVRDLGNIHYSYFMQDFFNDIEKITEKHNGTIFDNHGDHAFIVWELHNEINYESLDCYFAIRDHLELRRAYYFTNYNTTPSIKTSIHIGDSVKCRESNKTAHECYLGVAVNVTARILCLSPTTRKEILVSEDIQRLFAHDNQYKFIYQGSYQLKELKDQLKIYSVEKNSYRTRKVV